MTDLPADLQQAISAFADRYQITRAQAVERVLRQWLTDHGYLASHGDEGTRPEDLNASNDD